MVQTRAIPIGSPAVLFLYGYQKAPENAQTVYTLQNTMQSIKKGVSIGFSAFRRIFLVGLRSQAIMWYNVVKLEQYIFRDGGLYSRQAVPVG